MMHEGVAHVGKLPPDDEPVGNIGDAARPEARGQTTFLYAATCNALQRWSEEVGFRVVHLGVTDDPLHRVASLRGRGHANLSYFVRPFERDLDDGDWWCVPISPCNHKAADLPVGCAAWGGTIAVDLPEGVRTVDLARRLSLLLRPLEAQTCAQLPSVLEAHVLRSMFPPVMPRYSEVRGGRSLAHDIYKLSDPGDWSYLCTSLQAALTTFGTGRKLVDLLVETLFDAPSAREISSASC